MRHSVTSSTLHSAAAACRLHHKACVASAAYRAAWYRRQRVTRVAVQPTMHDTACLECSVERGATIKTHPVWDAAAEGAVRLWRCRATHRCSGARAPPNTNTCANCACTSPHHPHTAGFCAGATVLCVSMCTMSRPLFRGGWRLAKQLHSFATRQHARTHARSVAERAAATGADRPNHAHTCGRAARWQQAPAQLQRALSLIVQPSPNQHSCCAHTLPRRTIHAATVVHMQACNPGRTATHVAEFASPPNHTLVLGSNTASNITTPPLALCHDAGRHPCASGASAHNNSGLSLRHSLPLWKVLKQTLGC